MTWSFLPRQPYFFEGFVAMTRELRRGAGLLLELLESAPAKVELAGTIHEVEHRCDQITHDIIQRLNKTFVTPIDREDVHALAKALDDVMDTMDDAAELVPLHRVTVIRAGAVELARVVAAQTDQLVTATEHLPKMTAQVTAAIREIKRLEEQADELHKRAVGALFEEERDAIEAMKWKEFFDFLEDAADCAENAAHVLESICLKHG